MSYNPEHIRQDLHHSIAKLPLRIRQDDPEGGVLRPWVRSLPLRLQGVLLTGIRGCDGAPKEDSSKNLNRMIRRAVLNPADERETVKQGGFFGYSPTALEESLAQDFFHSLDQYPLHYIVHLMHSCEVIGYMHPDANISSFFKLCYDLFCLTLHVKPENKSQMLERLTEDRISKGITERNF